MILAVLGGVLVAPLLVLLFAFFRAAVLFWPTMLLLGAVHSHLAFVPALGWWATFLVVALLSLLIPSGASSSKSN